MIVRMVSSIVESRLQKWLRLFVAQTYGSLLPSAKWELHGGTCSDPQADPTHLLSPKSSDSSLQRRRGGYCEIRFTIPFLLRIGWMRLRSGITPTS